jgi:ribosomal protein S18 acetylase RimI-like enzyme
MKQPIEVVPVDIVRDAAEITRLLRRSFLDVAAALGLTEETCPSHVAFITQERLLAQLGRPDAHCLGIWEDGAWVGFVAVAPYHNAYEITRLAVLPERRHKGYGRALVESACQVAREMGLQEIGLGIVNDNTVLKRWYQTQGFVPGEPFELPGIPYAVCGLLKRL